MNIGGAPLARRGLLGSSVDELWPGRITPSMFFRLITDVFVSA